MSFKQSTHCLFKWYYYIYSELFHLNYFKAPLKSKTLLWHCIVHMHSNSCWFTDSWHHLIFNNGEIKSMFIEQWLIETCHAKEQIIQIILKLGQCKMQLSEKVVKTKSLIVSRHETIDTETTKVILLSLLRIFLLIV